MNIIPTAVANGFTASSSAGIQEFITGAWPITLALVVLSVSFPLLKKLISLIRHSVGK